MAVQNLRAGSLEFMPACNGQGFANKEMEVKNEPAGGNLLADRFDAAQQVKDDPQVTVVCSGTDRSITSEDVLFAGALLERIIALRTESSQPPGQLTDMASIALGHWKTTRRALDNGRPLADFFRNARGGLNLVKIGHDADIVFASQIDTFNLVPELDLKSWIIRVPPSEKN